MKKIFKTNIDDFEIFDLMIEYLKDDNLKLIIDKYPMLKFLCVPEGGKRFRFIRNKEKRITAKFLIKVITLNRYLPDIGTMSFSAVFIFNISVN